VVGFTIGSSGELPGERKPVMQDDDDVLLAENIK
jgi:hypothetical protein